MISVAAGTPITTLGGVAGVTPSGVVATIVTDIAVSLISNYVNQQIDAISQKAKDFTGKSLRKTFRYKGTRNRPRYRNYAKTYNARYRSRGSRSRRR